MLRAFLAELTDDKDTIADTIDGETNLKETIHGVLKAIGEDEILTDGIGVAIHALQQRKERCEWRIEKRRKAILLAMQAGEMPKIIYPEATISVGLARSKVVVTDEAKIPDIFFDPLPPQLNKAKLKAALSVAGNGIEGAALNNGGVQLTIKKL